MTTYTDCEHEDHSARARVTEDEVAIMFAHRFPGSVFVSDESGDCFATEGNTPQRIAYTGQVWETVSALRWFARIRGRVAWRSDTYTEDDNG